MYTPIPEAWRQVGQPLRVDMINNIHFNLEDLNTRVSSISLQAGAAIFSNSIIRKPQDTLPLGTVIHCSYSQAQLLAEMDGGEWVAADGANVAGSDWSTVTGRSVLPDARGRFIRGKDNGAGNSPLDPALDAFTADSIASHLHSINHGHSDTFAATSSPSGAHFHTLVADAASDQTLMGPGVDGAGQYQYIARQWTTTSALGYLLTGADTTPTSLGRSSNAPNHTHGVNMSGGVTNHTGNSGSTGGSETAPRYVTENTFIKINRSYIKTNTAQLVFRIPQDVRINDVLISPMEQGTSGSLVVDIKKGTTPTTATQSIFQSGNLPTLAYNATVGSTGLTDSNQNEVAAGQFIVVSVTSVQAKLKAFHIYIAGDL